MSDKTDTKVPVVALAPGQALRPIVPDSMDSAWRLAGNIIAGGMAARGDNQASVMLKIMCGLEVGLMPLQAVQGIVVVNGKPTLYGDALMGVVRGSGKVAWIKETFEGKGDELRAVCTTLRIGEDEPVTRTFSWAQAKKANLLGKKGPWTEYPSRMLQMRARGWCLRDVYADVLFGVGLAEEALDVGDVTAPRQNEQRTPPDPDMPEDKVEDAETEEMSETKSENVSDKVTPPDPDEGESDNAHFLGAFQNGLKLAKTVDDVEELWRDLEVESTLTHSADDLAMATTFRDVTIAKLKKAAKK